ncbi:MAG TPA: GTPase [Azospirillaceae bacterium]|nr:GTPase [Azospirillaceae bacterium]
MRLKSFQAATLAEALTSIRDAMGDDAIILETREEDGTTVITAAVEGEAFEPLTSLFRDAPSPQPDAAQLVIDAIHRHGVPPRLSRPMHDAIGNFGADDPLLALGMALDAIFTFQPLPPSGGQQAIALVGPSGSGKTLTAAKLASRAFFKGRSVTVVTADARPGNVEQLSAHLNRVDHRLFTVDSPEQVADALAEAPDDFVVIDTASSNHYDAEDMAVLRRIVAAGEIEPVLVLPAGMDAAEAVDTADAFRMVGVRRLVATRLDTTRRFGSLLAAAAETSLVFAEGGNGARVTDGLTSLSSVSLARLMMPEIAIPLRPRKGARRS